MKPNEVNKIVHLEWAVKSRARNQQSAIRLLRLYYEYKEQWETKQWASVAQEMLSVSFSLWRAAFLADKTAKRVEVLSDAIEFLEKIIEDNSISYGQDKKCNEWTFNYYTRNARASLEALHRIWPTHIPAYVVKIRKPIDRWEYCQDLLDEAVVNIETMALEVRSKQETKAKKAKVRSDAKTRRRRVREITSAGRDKRDNA